MVYLTDCVELMGLMPAGCVDVIFADPPYRLSGGGVSVQSGRLAPVDKGEWDRSMGDDQSPLGRPIWVTEGGAELPVPPSLKLVPIPP